MPKLKTNKSVAKRFSKTGSGKISRGSAYRRHLLSSKSRKRKRQLKNGELVSPEDFTRLNKLMPYA